MAKTLSWQDELEIIDRTMGAISRVTDPVALLACLNEQLVGSYAHAGAFVTAFYAILDPSTCELEYCVAGHNPPRLVSADRVESMGAGGGVPLGVLADERYVSARASIGDGDVLVLYTDGITEAMAPRAVSGTRELFGVGRLDEILERRRGVSARGCIDAVREGVEAFCQGAPPTDDRTLLAIRCGRGHGGER